MLRPSAASRLSVWLSARPPIRALWSARTLPGFSSTAAQIQKSSRHTPHIRCFTVTAPARYPPLSKTCPSCSSPLPTPLQACPNCFNISRLPSSVSYYDIFDIPYVPNPFDVDVGVLKARFRNLQRIIHPDKWSGRGNSAQDIAAEMSSTVNKAYTSLANPYTRCEYILQQEGIEIGESDSIDDPILIMEIMEAREELDNMEGQEEVDRIRRDNLEKIDGLLPELSAAIAEKDWSTAKKFAIKLKYLQGIDLAAQAWPKQPFDH